MTESTPAVITMLHGELGKAGEDEEAKLRVVQHTCKPVIRNLAKDYDEEDEKVTREKKELEAAKTAEEQHYVAERKAREAEQNYQNAFNNVIQAFSKGQVMHSLAAKYMTFQHYWKIFIPVQIIVTLAALLAFFAAVLLADADAA